MSNTVTVFSDGIETTCPRCKDELCYYHAKMRDGHIQPEHMVSTPPPVAVMIDGEAVWGSVPEN